MAVSRRYPGGSLLSAIASCAVMLGRKSFWIGLSFLSACAFVDDFDQFRLSECAESCAAPAAHCHSSGECVECLGDVHCRSSDAGAGGRCVANRCVGCTRSADCNGNAVCDDGLCVECAGHSDCLEPERSRCDATRRCVSCGDEPECAHHGTLPICLSGTCVECAGSDECNDPARPFCGSLGACEGCQRKDDCAHLGATTECDTSSGACVACTVATEATNCGSDACDPVGLVCTGITRGTRQQCQSCLADSECATGHACIAMTFRGADRAGGYCLRQNSTCERPFRHRTTAMSRSGAASAQYCGVDQTRTTCEAVNALVSGQGCAAGLDSECGAPSDSDGLCRTVGTVVRSCSYECQNALDCPNGMVCSAIVTPNHCDAS